MTFCNEMDEMLGGGVPVGELTEFCELLPSFFALKGHEIRVYS